MGGGTEKRRLRYSCHTSFQPATVIGFRVLKRDTES
jgi:hypothetical protein